jgi:transposase InsO family protein
MHDRTSNNRSYRILNIIDEFTKECLIIEVNRNLNSDDVQYALTQLFLTHGTPECIRSDNGKEFTGKVREWLNKLKVRTLFIEPGSPWENGYIESFNSRLRDNLLNGEIFDNILEAKVVIEQWRKEYNTIRPHSALNYTPPAPEAKEPLSSIMSSLST